MLLVIYTDNNLQQVAKVTSARLEFMLGQYYAYQLSTKLDMNQY